MKNVCIAALVGGSIVAGAASETEATAARRVRRWLASPLR
jgi:hypothetical protein